MSSVITERQYELGHNRLLSKVRASRTKDARHRAGALTAAPTVLT